MIPSRHDADLTRRDAVSFLERALAVAVSVWVIVYAYTGPIIPRRQHANAVIGVGLAVFYIGRVLTRSETDRESLRDRLHLGFLVVLAAAVLGITAYIHVSYFRWQEFGRLLIYTRTDVLLGAALVYIVTDATFRAYGRVLGAVVVVAMAYGLFGNYLPGFLYHSGFSLEMLIVRQTVVLSGIFGFLSRIGATWIAIFIIFAGIVEGYGGFEYIRKIGAALARRSRSMVAQTAIVASMFMGTMMGSSASNVATTGSFTIPLMKRQGISTRTAGAAEALASTGGQILPPIMGTAAFIMADILGISFGTVALGATIPAILYYVAVSLGIHYAIRKEGFVSETDSASVDTEALLDIDELPDRRTLALQGVQYLIPVSVLVVLLMILQYGPMNAGLYTIASLLVVRAVKAGFNRTPVEFVTNTVRGLYIGGKNLAPFMAILASLGIVIDIISGTGLGHTIAISTVQFAGQNVAIIVVVVMIVCLLFGLGLPTPAAYVLVATILAPLLIEQGVQPLPAHLFIFYFALLSAITPPVALAVAVAVGVSGGNFYRTAKKTLQIGGPLFVLPYLFLLNPAVVLVEYPDALVQFVALGSAVVSAVSALLGVNGSRILSYPERAGFAAVFVLVAAGSVFGTAYQAAGVALFLLLVVAYLLVTDAYGTLLNSDRLVDRLHGQ